MSLPARIRSQRVREAAWFFAAAVMLTGLVFSKFLLSCGMFLFAIYAVLYWMAGIRLAPAETRSAFRDFFRQPDLLALWVIFLLILFSWPYSEDTSFTMFRLRINLPLLVLPFILGNLPPVRKSCFLHLHLYFLLLLVISGSWSLVQYGLNYNEINAGMARGLPFPTTANHIRLSLMMAYACLASVSWLVFEPAVLKPWQRTSVISATGFLLLLLHVISVRSGLLAVYAGFLVLGLVWFVRQHAPWKALLLVPVFLAIAWMAYRTLPSLQRKIDYTFYDVKMWREGRASDYSFGDRMTSYQVAWQIWKRHFWLGVGSGDVEREVKKLYLQHYPESRIFKLPHNQFLYVAAGNGLIGLLLFCGALFIPLLYRGHFRYLPYLMFWLTVMLSFLIEYTLETSVGNGFVAGFFSLYLNLFRGNTFQSVAGTRSRTAAQM